MLLGDFISPNSVVSSLKAKTKKQLLQDLSARAARLTGLQERDIFDVSEETTKSGEMKSPEKHQPTPSDGRGGDDRADVPPSAACAPS